jgi:cell division septation protein DedD
MADSETEYWFNTRTKQVEIGKQSIAVYRIGPFKTRSDAEHALENIAAKSKAWREEQERED